LYKLELNHNPDYKLFYFDDNDCLNYIKNTKDERIIKAYNKLIPTAYKADLWRYIILKEYGGIYADFSMRFLKKYDYIIQKYEGVFVKDFEDFGLYNAFFAVKKNNLLINKTIETVLNFIEQDYYGRSSLSITGPTALGDCYKEINNIENNVLIKCGCDNNNYFIYELFENSFVINKDTSEKIIKTRIEEHYSILYKSDIYNSYDYTKRYSILWDRLMVYKNERYLEIKKLLKYLLDRDIDDNEIYIYYSSNKTIEQIRKDILQSIQYEKNKKIRIEYLKNSNKIPILMPMYNRPDYLKITLNALKKCQNIEKFFIITFEEPNEDCSKIVDNIDFVEVIRFKNINKLGIKENFASLLKIALKFEKFIVLEDDIVPNRDFLNYFLWAFNEYNNNENVKTISAYSRTNGNPNDVELKNEFCPWGWGSWSRKLNGFIDFSFKDTYGWDESINKYIIYNKLFSVKPIISRVQNIGECGTYVVSPEWHNINHHTKYTIDELNIEPISNFNLIT